MKKTTSTKRAREARKEQTQQRIAQRKQPLFEHEGWTITRYDDMNLDLRHKDDSPRTHRYYSTLEAALRGMAKQVGLRSKDLREAIAAVDRLNTTLERVGI